MLKEPFGLIFSVFAHFRQTDGVRVNFNFAAVPVDRQNRLNMTRSKQWIRVISINLP